MSGHIRTLVIDSSVLIDFIKVQRLDLLAALPGTKCLITEHVLEEVTYPDQKTVLRDAIKEGYLTVIRVDTTDEVVTFAGLSGIGLGEKSAFTVAFHRGFDVVLYDNKACRRVGRQLGIIRTLSLIDIMIDVINAQVLSLMQADELLRAWKTDPKFRHQDLKSFADVM